MSQDESKNASPVHGRYAPLSYPPRAQPPQYPPRFPGYSNFAYTPGMVGLPTTKSLGYIASSRLPSAPPADETTGGHSKARLALILGVIFVIGSLMLGVFTWMLLGNNGPQFEVRSFTMPSLNVTNNNTALEAEWEVNITATNPSRKREFFSGEIEGSLIYRGVVLGMDVIDPLSLGAESESLLSAKFSVQESASDGSAPGIPAPVVAMQMEEDRRIGMAEFDLRLIMDATYSSDHALWSKRSTMRVLCGDIRVLFPSPTGGGAFYGLRVECLTYNN